MSEFLDLSGLSRFKSKLNTWVAGLIAAIANPNESVTFNANGQLQVGGRLGQFLNGGIFYATDRQPRNVAENTFLITDALGIEMNANRSFAIASGVGLNVKGKHNAGVTEYHIANNYNNRIRCAACQYLSLDEATSKVEMIVPVVSCTIDGQAFTPDSSPDDSTKDIIIVTESSVNPNNALNSGASIRAFGAMNGYASAFIGSCVGAGTGGANFILGQGVYSKTGNMNVVLGQYHYNQGNGNSLLGRWHVSMKNRWLLAGTGHDNTNGMAEAGTAVGAFSDIQSDTAFAVGNGTSAVARSNAFEVKADGRVKASDPTEADDLVTKGYVDSVTTYDHTDFTYEQVLDPDTQEVINECVAYSTAAGNANQPTATKVGRVVNLAGAFKNINVRPDNTAFDMGKVPAGCEPLKTQYILSQGSSQYKFMLTIRPDGTLNCSRYSTGASAIAVTNGAWLNINATYIAAS